ncbi:MAG TPA: hypothetical protein VLJ10_02960 [Candidatus Bathyarchaeia archaeon]|nr:hypothetical protein [Candidatus Bathyarchaeia archaeon]
MEVIITGWAFNSYLEMTHNRVFGKAEYKNRIRPDVLRLKNYPDDSRFENDKFWSIATDRTGNKIRDGYKMKWHQVGDGRVQLRLTVGIFSGAFLCEAYVKNDPKAEKRYMARFKVYLQKIRLNEYVENGRLS